MPRGFVNRAVTHHNWIVNNLSRRQHQTKLDGKVSRTLPINASIIQGSGLGPVEYVFTASDLNPTNQPTLQIR